MKLVSAHIKNFKLLKSVDLAFSIDEARPLTVIRAENGSGKTSILYALRWAMYGAKDGLPHPGMRLTAAKSPPGRPVTVQVRVEFTTTEPYTGEEVRYRLIRSCEETPGEDDSYKRTKDKLRLLRQTPAGEEDIEHGKEGLIHKLLPPNLADVFFTNGDDVQRFISSGQRADRERQQAVHNAIRQLLGLDNVEAAAKHLATITKSLKRKLANEAGGEVLAARNAHDDLEDRIAAKEHERDNIHRRIEAVEERIRETERELDSIRGIGDLEAAQARIKGLREDLEELDARENDIRDQMKSLLRSETLSWRLLGARLQQGVDNLEELANRKVIPGVAIEVLTDRLELGICICGEELAQGSDRYAHVEHLVEQQRLDSSEQQRLSTLWHVSRQSSRVHQEAAIAGTSFEDIAGGLRQQYTGCVDIRHRKKQDLDAEQAKRNQIDDERVQILTDRIKGDRNKQSNYDRQYGEVEGQLRGLEERLGYAKDNLRKAEQEATLNEATRLRLSGGRGPLDAREWRAEHTQIGLCAAGL